MIVPEKPIFSFPSSDAPPPGRVRMCLKNSISADSVSVEAGGASRVEPVGIVIAECDQDLSCVSPAFRSKVYK